MEELLLLEKEYLKTFFHLDFILLKLLLLDIFNFKKKEKLLLEKITSIVEIFFRLLKLLLKWNINYIKYLICKCKGE